MAEAFLRNKRKFDRNNEMFETVIGLAGQELPDAFEWQQKKRKLGIPQSSVLDFGEYTDDSLHDLVEDEVGSSALSGYLTTVAKMGLYALGGAILENQSLVLDRLLPVNKERVQLEDNLIRDLSGSKQEEQTRFGWWRNKGITIEEVKQAKTKVEELRKAQTELDKLKGEIAESLGIKDANVTASAVKNKLRDIKAYDKNNTITDAINYLQMHPHLINQETLKEFLKKHKPDSDKLNALMGPDGNGIGPRPIADAAAVIVLDALGAYVDQNKQRNLFI